MKVCPNCNFRNREQSKFCAECGTKLGNVAKFCPECGTKLEENPKFCPECGFNLTASELDSEDNAWSSSMEEYLGDNNSYSDDDEEYDDDDDEEYDDDDDEEYDDDDEEEYDDDDEEYDDDDDEEYDDNDDEEYDDNDDEEYDDNDDDDGEYEEYVDEDEYRDEETTEEKIRKIVNKYIVDISKDHTSYTSGAINNHKYFQVVQNIRSKIAPQKKQSELYGFVDVTIFGKGKAGLLFTNDTLYEKGSGGSIRLPYRAITGMYIKNGTLYFKNTQGYGFGLSNVSEVNISDISYNTPSLKDCLEEIIAIL